MTKEELIEVFKEKIESLSEAELNEVSVLCIISDKVGVGEIMLGKGHEICNALCHTLVGNGALMDIVEVALKVAKKYLENNLDDNDSKEYSIPIVANKYKS